jgi:hypothetical protein
LQNQESGDSEGGTVEVDSAIQQLQTEGSTVSAGVGAFAIENILFWPCTTTLCSAGALLPVIQNGFQCGPKNEEAL